MNDQPDVIVHSNRPETHVLGPVEFVELETRMRGVDLEIEGCGLGGLLFVACEFCETVGKCICDAKFHYVKRVCLWNVVAG